MMYRYSGILDAALFGAVVGGGLGFLMSLIVESLSGKKLSSRTKNVLVWVGVIIGYAVIKTLISR